MYGCLFWWCVACFDLNNRFCRLSILLMHILFFHHVCENKGLAYETISSANVRTLFSTLVDRHLVRVFHLITTCFFFFFLFKKYVLLFVYLLFCFSSFLSINYLLCFPLSSNFSSFFFSNFPFAGDRWRVLVVSRAVWRLHDSGHGHSQQLL